LKKRIAISFQIALLLLIGLGIYFRFYRLDWYQGAQLHPDEYGLTNQVKAFFHSIDLSQLVIQSAR
jgi:hypothetical protein